MFRQLVENQRLYFLSGQPARLEHRREQLRKFRKALLDGKDILTTGVQKDLGRLPKVTYTFELASVITEIDYVLDNLKKWSEPINAEKTMATMLDTPQIVKEPKGVVLAMGPWNYPLNSLLLPLVGVLAAGNTAIVKPSEVASHTATAVDQVLSQAFDKRYLAVVLGGVDESQMLLKERFDHILFTGSTVVARSILKAAAEHLTPCTLELGGKCPVFVENDADIQATAYRIAWGKWLNCGQTCLAPDYILVNPSIKQKLVDALKQAIFEFYGSNIQKSADYSRIINEKHFDRINSLLEQTKGKMLFRGSELDRGDCFIPPIILESSLDDEIMKGEIFGPVLPIVEVRDLQDAVEFIRSRERPLAAYIFTKSDSKAQAFIDQTTSGSVTVNDVIVQITVDTLPFGGIGHSGMGRYRGKFGFDEFSHEKAVLKRGFFGEGLGALRYPPLTDKKLERLNKLVGTRRGMPKWIKNAILAMPYVLIGLLLGWLTNRIRL